MNPTFRAAYSPRAAYSFSPVHDSEPDRPVAYVCTVCGRSFPFLSSLSQHMRRHTGSRPYKCPYCPHRASQKGNLKVHIRSHKLSMLISSGLQWEELGNNGSVELGVKEGLEVKTTPTKSISPCKREMNGKTFWRTLKREKRGVTQWLYCRLCGHEAQREDQLLSHIEKVHITIDPEQCGSLPEAGGEVGESIFTCELCRQSFSQALLLQVHRRKHCAPLHICSVCDRTFSQVWFLKSHMRTHSRGRALARGRSTTQSQLLTINVSQDPKPSSAPGSTGLYELCSECGHIFHNSESLKVHIQVHTLSRTGQQQCGDQTLSEGNQQSPTTKRCFMEYLCLRPVGYIGNGDDERSRLGCRVRQMNPVCSAQAWKLATRGHLLTSVKGTEASASAETLDQGRPCLLIPKGAERCQARRRSLGGSGNCTAECPELQSDTEYLPCYRTARCSPNIKPRECFECGKVFRNRSRLSVHIRTQHRDSRSSGGEADPGSPSPSNTCSTQRERGDNSRAAKSTQAATDEKMYIGSQCDYITTASSDFLSHVHCAHPCSVAVLGNGCPSLSPHASVDTTASLSRMKNELLHRPVSGLQVHPSSTAQPQSQMKTAYDAHSPAAAQAVHDSDPESRRHPQSQTRVQEEALDLCICLDGTRDSLTPSAVQEALPCHQCCYCNYSTQWLEVLWMHQNIAHRISSNTVAPSWAPIKTSRCTKEGLLLGRRTGPPPALDGKECPPLAMVTRSQRTCPPTVTQNATVHWSVSMSSEKAGQANPGEPHGSRTQVGEKRDQGVMRVCIESRAQLGSTGLGSAKVLDKSPIIQAAGFNTESIKTCKDGLSKNSSYIQSTNAPNYMADNGYRVSWPQEGTIGVSRSSQKQGPKIPDPMDVLSFLKQCNSCDPAVPYRSCSTSKLQPPNRVGDGCQQKGYMRQGFGKDFRQSSHLCIHVKHSHQLEDPGTGCTLCVL